MASLGTWGGAQPKVFVMGLLMAPTPTFLLATLEKSRLSPMCLHPKE